MIKNKIFCSGQTIDLATGETYTLKTDEVFINGHIYKKKDLEVATQNIYPTNPPENIKIAIKKRDGVMNLPTDFVKFNEWEISGSQQITLTECVENLSNCIYFNENTESTPTEVNTYQEIEDGDAGIYILTTLDNGYDANSKFIKLTDGTIIYEKISTVITTADASRSLTKSEDIIFITGNCDLTLNEDLLENYNIVVKMGENDDYTCNILAGANVTIEPVTFQLTKGKMCSIIRFPNSNKFIISQ